MTFDLTSSKKLPKGMDLIITNLMVPALTTHSDARYVHPQDTQSTEFTINHNLGKYPSVTFVDYTGELAVGNYTYDDENNITCRFDKEFSGTVYLN